MMNVRSYGMVLLGVWTLAAVPVAYSGELTALDRYVAKPDANYQFKLDHSVKGEGYTAYVLAMTSQAWLTTNEINKPIWKHWLTITKPNEVISSTALLFIGGGGNDKPAPKGPDGSMSKLATSAKTVVAELRMVPNQPLVYAGETNEFHEDSLIAYAWDKFLRTGDEKWPPRLPMTKSAVRAMDTITAFCASDEGGQLKVDRFMVAGGSKRGWTTWTTAIVDKRVIAIAPIVIDMLNIQPSFEHHYAVYGFWAPAIDDYTHLHIMDWNGTPEYKALMKIVEPYEYRDRLTLPKFMINASGDQFFLPDSAQFYFKDLPGVKYMRYVPNADHSLKDTDALQSLLAFYHAIVTRAPLPEFSWTADAEGAFKVTARTPPKEVKLWQANNPKARDFRLETIGPAWKSTVLEEKDGWFYTGQVEKPDQGWTAYFVELTFPSTGPSPFKFTTEVKVKPDTTLFKFEPDRSKIQSQSPGANK